MVGRAFSFPLRTWNGLIQQDIVHEDNQKGLAIRYKLQDLQRGCNSTILKCTNYISEARNGHLHNVQSDCQGESQRFPDQILKTSLVT